MSSNESSLKTFEPFYRLDGLVDLEPTSLLIYSNFLEYRGTLQPTGRIVTIKRPRFASEHTNEVLSIVVLVIYVYCFPSALNSAPTRSRKHSPLPWYYYGVQQYYNINSGRIYGLGKRVWLCQKSWSQSSPFGTSPLMSLPCAHFGLGIQLHGLARAIRYLHTHPSGPIFHGDIRGVRV